MKRFRYVGFQKGLLEFGFVAEQETGLPVDQWATRMLSNAKGFGIEDVFVEIFDISKNESFKGQKPIITFNLK